MKGKNLIKKPHRIHYSLGVDCTTKSRKVIIVSQLVIIKSMDFSVMSSTFQYYG